MTIITALFNTGRKYTAEGQLVLATYDPQTLTLQFDDYSRMLTGQYNEVSVPLDQLERWRECPEIFARFVMHKYDRGGYVYAPERRIPDGPVAQYCL